MTLEVREERAHAHPHVPQVREWTFPDGRPWTRFYRTERGFLLRFPGLADFELDPADDVVVCFPFPGVSTHTVWHLFHSQVLPLALSRQGKLVFHASAIEVQGVAIAFMGASGKGKSTLAASFATNGSAFLTDDGLQVERSAGEWVVVPSQPSLRLWDDAQQALVGNDATAAAPLEFTSKGRFLAGKALQHCSEPRRLARICILGNGNSDVPTLEGLPPAEALIELVRHSFLLDTEAPELLSTHFNELTALLSQVPCVRYDFPRSFESLGQVRAVLMRDLAERRVCESA